MSFLVPSVFKRSNSLPKKQPAIWQVIEQGDWATFLVLLEADSSSSFAAKSVSTSNSYCSPGRRSTVGSHHSSQRHRHSSKSSIATAAMEADLSSRRLTVFSFAISYSPPLNVVQRLIQKNPDALSTEDVIGRLPLHIACRFGCTRDAIEAMIEGYPRGVTRRDDKGNVPLHYAVSDACDSGPASIRGGFLRVLRSSKRLQQRDDGGDSSLQLRNLEKCGAVIALILAAPTCVLLRNNKNESPLELACSLQTNDGNFNSVQALVLDILNRVTDSLTHNSSTTTTDNPTVTHSEYAATNSCTLIPKSQRSQIPLATSAVKQSHYANAAA